MPVRDLDALLLKKDCLHVLTAECESGGEAAVPIDDSVTGDHPGLWVHVQSVSHNAGPSRVPRERGDRPISRDPALGYPLHLFIDKIESIHIQ